MSILSTIRNLPEQLAKAIVQRYAYSSFELAGPRSIQRPTDAKSLVDNHFSGWVYACASRNAETITGCPLRLYVRGGTRNYYVRRSLSKAQAAHIEAVTGKAADTVDEVTDGHPLIELLDFMNGEQTRTEVLEGTVTWQEITGDAYWYLEPGPLGMPGAIWPLMSQYTRVVRDGQGQLVGYLYGKTDRIALEASEVIHFRYPHPGNADYGKSPLEAAFGAAQLLESQQGYEQSMYDSGGMPEIGLLVKGTVTPDQKKAMYADWRRRFQNKRAGEKFVILEGDVDIKTFGLPPKDVGVQFTQKFSREEIAAAFGVPMTLLQLQEAARAGAEAGHYAYMRYTIAPKLRRLADKLTEQLAARYDNRLFFAFDNPVPEDREFRLKQITARLSTRMTTVNEERALDGLGPVAWGDEPVTPTQPPVAQPEPEKSIKSAPPMNSFERSFAADLEGYFEKFAKETVRRAQDAQP